MLSTAQSLDGAGVSSVAGDGTVEAVSHITHSHLAAAAPFETELQRIVGKGGVAIWEVWPRRLLRARRRGVDAAATSKASCGLERCRGFERCEWFRRAAQGPSTK